MDPVGDISGVEADHPAPPLVGKEKPGLRRRELVLRKR